MTVSSSSSVSLLAVGDLALDSPPERNPLGVLSELRRRPALTLANLSVPIVAERVTEAAWFAHIARPYLADNAAAWRCRIRRYGMRHALQAARWTVSSFVLRCGLGWLRSSVFGHGQDLR